MEKKLKQIISKDLKKRGFKGDSNNLINVRVKKDAKIFGSLTY